MHSTEIKAYTLDGSIYCPDCAERTDHRYTVQIGRRYGSSAASAVYTGEIDLGTHDSLRMAIEYAREQCEMDLDDAGEIDREDGVTTHWTTDEIDGDPIFAGYETDTPHHCGECGDLIDGQSLTRRGQRYVADHIAEYIAGESEDDDADILAIWSDLTDHSYSSTDLDLARDCFSSIGGTYSHGSLRPVDLLEAAIDAAQALHDWIACRPAYHNGNTRRCADLQTEMVRAEQALAAFADVDTDVLEDDGARARDVESIEENVWYALESINDTINAHLPPPLYYGAREGDGSDIAIQVSAEY